MDFTSRREVEAYLERLNRASPVALRQVARWGGSEDSLHVRAIAMPERYADLGVFMGESRTSFAMSIDARHELPASVPYSIGLVLSGGMCIHGPGGERVVRAGEGVIVNPAEVERTWMESGTHLVEFMLPKAPMLSLGAEWAPGRLTGQPRFEPLLNGALAQRLHAMAQEAARALPSGMPRNDGLFRRWLEMIGLTLLHEQPIQNAAQARLSAPEPPPGALRRALDFIHAHAAEDIMLADIASAAHLSVSSLGRLFNKHLGQSPAALLRDLRLDRVHDELRRGTPASIRELALRWGFQSPSQFSQAYQRRFGKKPSETRG
ncbi:AraC family transcriptional regulator [Paucibacter sp. R3-3]|uniref:AraC family transcriptional regulator n=1 Tax=Roseateles agri TaxID=3098619 RepID=A0ABU5DK29_9BURK|nr:AraC family transcriptional regulator [Paucibacter sp. R3-3]MDY0746484.1 AraC family transcriptional regulator [Paucibacter sp. R3-3]